MKRGRTPLKLSLLGLGFLVCVGFFVPTITPVTHAQAEITTKEQLDKLLKEAVGKEPIQTSKAILAAMQAGPYKATPISPVGADRLVCAKMTDGSWYWDGKMKDSCDAWSVAISRYNAAIINFYTVQVSGETKVPYCTSDAAASFGKDTTIALDGSSVTCVPTNTQIESLKGTMEGKLTLLFAAVNVSKAEAAVSDAQKTLDDSKCQQNPSLVDPANDAPSAEFVAQYKKGHPNDPVPTCQQLRDTVAQTSAALKQAQDAAKGANPAAPSCSWTSTWGECFVGILASVISTIEWLILLVAAGILGLANYLLGWTTYVTVFQFGNLIGNSEGLLAAWGVMRDVANIVLLFGFIFLGISTILNLRNSEYTAKKAIPALIIFALLLNFSLFAVEAVIDVSNAIATSIYVQATKGSGICAEDTGTVDCIFKQGIGGQVMSMSGMTSIFDFSSNNTFGEAGGDSSQTVVIYAGLIIFAVVTTLVLFAASIMLIIRAVVLAFLMVTAPIGFAGMAIPPLHEMASRWWKELISQAIFAPVYFLLALLSLKIMSGIITALTPEGGGTASAKNLAAVFTLSGNAHQSSNITIAMSFALIIGFMVAALMFAKKSSAMGTSIAMAGAGKMAFGTLGFVGRNTAGRAMYRASEGLKKTNFGRTNPIGRITTRALGKGGAGSFDYRGAKSIGATALTGALGNLGTAQKGGYAGVVHARQEMQEKYAKDLKNTEEEKARLAAIPTEIQGAQNFIESAKAFNDTELARLGEELAKQNALNEAALAPKKQEIDKRRAEIDSLRESIDTKRKEQDAASSAGDNARAQSLGSEIATAESYEKTLQSTLAKDQGVYDVLKVQADTSVKDINASMAKAKKQYESIVTEKRKEIAGLNDEMKAVREAPKRQFAKAIEHPGVLGMSVGRITGSSNVGDHHAAEAILRELDKSENQKLLDALGDFKKKTNSSVPVTKPADTAD